MCAGGMAAVVPGLHVSERDARGLAGRPGRDHGQTFATGTDTERFA